MIRRFVTINKSSYAVPSAEMLDDLKQRVVAAALAGAGVVELPTQGVRSFSVMITPHHLVVFEERQVEDDFYQITEAGVEFLGDGNDEFASFDY